MKSMIEQGVDAKFAAKLSLEVLNHMLNKYGIEKFPIIEDIKGDLWNISVGCSYSSECSKFLTTFVPETVEYGSYLGELATGKKIRKELTEPKNSGAPDPFALELEDGYKHKPKAKNVEIFDQEGEGDLGGDVYPVPEIKEAEESIRKYAKNSKEAEVAILKLHKLISEIDEASEEDLRALREKSKETNSFITTLKKLNPFQVSDAEAAVPLVIAAEACAVNPACAAGLAALGAATLVAGKNAIESTYEFVKKLHDGSNSANVIKQKVTTAASSGGMPDPDDDWDPRNGKDDRERFEWKVKDPKDSDEVVRHQKFGKFYKDSSQKLGNKDIWWTKDTAGHGGSRYKLFIEKNGKFEWFADVDEFGKVMSKHKGEVGKVISKKDLIGVK